MKDQKSKVNIYYLIGTSGIENRACLNVQEASLLNYAYAMNGVPKKWVLLL